jgi:hypothetical protein
MGQTSSPETLVSYQKTTPGKNPKDFIQHYDRGGSLQSHNNYDIKNNEPILNTNVGRYFIRVTAAAIRF